MLNVSNVSQNIFTGTNPASSVEMVPVVSAEWNQNLFNPPYITLAGTGVLETSGSPTISGSPTVTTLSSSDPLAMTGVTTYSVPFTSNQNTISYTINTASPHSSAYKIVTYMQTNSNLPMMVNAYAQGSNTQYGSTSVEVNSFGYTKITTYLGSSGTSDLVSSFVYTIAINPYSNNNITSGNPLTVYFTTPEAFATTYFDYQNHSLWPTESVFQFFRPGESYVYTGNSAASLPSNFREINSEIINGVTGNYPPVTPIIQNPSFTVASSPVPIMKNALPSDMAPYHYFVSDPGIYTDSVIYHPSISAIYQPSVNANKIVLKFNTIMTTPTLTVNIGNSTVSNVQPNSEGVLVLYWNGSTWSTSKWSTMPTIGSNGSITNYTSFQKITVTQTAVTVNSSFSSYSSKSSYVTNDLGRMHVVEISPRIEIDLSAFVMELDINKQLDSKNNYIPISSINPNDAALTLSAIPLTVSNSPVPIFSSQSDLTINILYNMMRKNIKFYFGWNIISYFQGSNTLLNSGNGQYIPAGVYWSNAWDETDIQTVKVTCYDVVNYLQTIPAPDYVANLKSVFDIITNILDLVGFTDYDFDTLYSVCNSGVTPMDIYYYYCNSQDSTVYDVLSEIFLANQIGAYIDEFGIMKFLSLAEIVNNPPSITTFDDASIITGGYSITNKAKPGLISVRYQEPKILQSLSLQNASDVNVANSSSFIYTTSNDVVWQQQNMDSVGFNYLASTMDQNDNFFTLNQNDALDIFHTYSLNSNGYAAIENEIVSMAYKEYTISQYSNPSNSVTISVKNDIELSAAINAFNKSYQTQLLVNTATITGATPTTMSWQGLTRKVVVYNTASSNLISFLNVGQNINISGVSPLQFNRSGEIIAVTSSTFTILSSTTGTYLSGGLATASTDYDIKITPTGRMTQVQRGLFGTAPSQHSVITSLSQKGLTEGTLSSSYLFSGSGSSTSVITPKYPGAPDNPTIRKIAVTPTSSNKSLVYSSTNTDQGYGTYSVQFDINNHPQSGSGLFFNLAPSTQSANGAFFVELIQYDNVSISATASDLNQDVTTGIGETDSTQISFYPAVSGIVPGMTITGTANATGAKVLSSKVQTTANEKTTLVTLDTPLTGNVNQGDTYIFSQSKYALAVYEVADYKPNVIAWSDVTNAVTNIISNFEKVLVKTSTNSSTNYSYSTASDQAFKLKAVVYNSDGTDGETSGVVLDVFLNNVEISGWQIVTPVTGTPAADLHTWTYSGSLNKFPSFSSGTVAWQPTPINLVTGRRQKITIPTTANAGTIFGYFTSSTPVPIQNLSYSSLRTISGAISNLREIYAVQKPLKDRNVNYYYQEQEFLNSLIQGQNNFAQYQSYIMQTSPVANAINYYDVQYTTPAATIVDVLPVEYLWYYLPGTEPSDQQYYQSQVVDEYSLSYSTPINTGFRARMAIANNANHMVYLNKQSDSLNQFAVSLNLWTHEIIALSDAQVLQKVLDPTNTSEVIQVDSEWIQSKESANKLINVIKIGNDGFSKDTAVQVFGNPLVQVGDIVTVSYRLAGISSEKYLVHEVSHVFKNGLKTTLTLNSLNRYVQR